MLKGFVVLLSLTPLLAVADWSKEAEQTLFSNCQTALEKRGLSQKTLRVEVCRCFTERVTGTLSLEDMNKSDKQALEMFVAGSLKMCIDKTINRLRGVK